MYILYRYSHTINVELMSSIYIHISILRKYCNFRVIYISRIITKWYKCVCMYILNADT